MRTTSLTTKSKSSFDSKENQQVHNPREAVQVLQLPFFCAFQPGCVRWAYQSMERFARYAVSAIDYNKFSPTAVEKLWIVWEISYLVPVLYMNSGKSLWKTFVIRLDLVECGMRQSSMLRPWPSTASVFHRTFSTKGTEHPRNCAAANRPRSILCSVLLGKLTLPPVDYPAYPQALSRQFSSVQTH